MASNFNPGDKLANCYLLKEKLPLGGLGAVWLARDEELNKDIALHFIPDAVAADAKAMGELRQETKRNRQLIHPRIVRVYELVEGEGWAAISMDHAPGETLAALQARKEKKAFQPSEISAWLTELCLTLEDAHRIDLIHRDLAPENLLATPNGLMVLNFGISRVILDALPRLGQPVEGGRDIAYIGPQQLDGERPDRQDDLYSLGVVAYQLLTGAGPYDTKGPGDLVSKIRKAVPLSVSERRAALGISGEAIPAGWEKTIAACLSKSREERPKTAAEAGAGFGAVTAKVPAPAPTPAPVHNVPAAVEATAVAAAAAVEAAEKTAPAPEKAPPASPAPAAPATPAAKETPAPAAPTPPAAEKDADIGSKLPKRPWGQPGQAGPGKTPVITEATVISKTSVAKTEKTEPKEEKTTPLGEKGATERAGTVGANPTTPSGFPLRAFVEVDDSGKKKGGKPPIALIAIGAVVLAVLVIGYLVANKGGGGSSEESPGTANSGTNSEIRASNSEETAPEASPAVAEATPAPAPSAAEVAVASTPVPESSPAVAPGGDIAQQLDQAKAALAAAQKDAQARADAQTAAAAAAQAADQAAQQKAADVAAAKKAAGDAAAALQKQQSDLQKADADAQAAQKAADALRKSVQDGQAAAKKQQDAEQQAEAAAAETGKAAAQRRQEADAAAKAAAAASAAVQQQALAVQNLQGNIEQQQMQQQQANAEKQRQAQEAAQRAAQLQQERAAETAKLAEQASAAAKAAEEAKVALAAAEKAVADAEQARIKADREAEAARNGTLPMPAPEASPAATPAKATSAATPPPAVPVASPAHAAASPAGAAPSITVHVPNPHSKVDATLTNSLGMRFAPVGNVLVGVWLTRVQDFDAFARAAGFKSDAWQSPGFKQAPDHPVVNVSWNDAMQFCLWLTEKEHREGILAMSETYRLPTDLEWSKAVGLPNEPGATPESRDMDVPDVYPWGKQWPPPAGAGNYTGEETDSDVAIKGYNDGFAWTSPVGSFSVNKLGLYDMGGNVWEWCLDWWNPEQKAKVLRGGSWYNGALKLSLLSSCRIHASADSQTDNYGFRIVIADEMSKAAASPAKTPRHR